MVDGRIVGHRVTRAAADRQDAGRTPQPSTQAKSSSTFTAAYERRLPEMMALRESELAIVTVEPWHAVTTVLGVLAYIQDLRERESALGELDGALLEDLADYTCAAAEASSRFRTAGTTGPGVALLDERARKVRRRLRLAAGALVECGLIDGGRLGSFVSRELVFVDAPHRSPYASASARSGIGERWR